eukprot:GHVR01099067.1.p2 GENE.GHVR01099067.1~~GHVR01099067.1.p2  ORF type:complete len:100 (+),score=8.25 GHVR01099067.1:1287-1586(+)
MAKSLEPNGYKPCILNKTLEDEGYAIKRFSFRIVKSTNDWVAVGLCHQKLITDSNYEFNYQQQGHGFYLISSNGGSWSSIDKDYNNVVKAFKFVTGDII